jgi:hypothetical protein
LVNKPDKTKDEQKTLRNISEEKKHNSTMTPLDWINVSKTTTFIQQTFGKFDIFL